MVQFQVDSVEVARAAGQTRLTAASIRGEVATMMGQLLALQQSWTGSASTAFATCADQWRALQTQVEASLDSIGAALDSSSAQYDEAENSVRGMFSA